MDSIDFTLPINPIAWKRPGQAGHTRFDMQKKEKTSIGLLMRHAMASHPPFSSPISVTKYFYFISPKKLSSPFPSSKPDIDNLAKFIHDAGNTICWLDDSLICEEHNFKLFSPSPSIRIIIRALHD